MKEFRWIRDALFPPPVSGRPPLARPGPTSEPALADAGYYIYQVALAAKKRVRRKNRVFQLHAVGRVVEKYLNELEPSA